MACTRLWVPGENSLTWTDALGKILNVDVPSFSLLIFYWVLACDLDCRWVAGAAARRLLILCRPLNLELLSLDSAQRVGFVSI